jgi:hypothetical protein
LTATVATASLSLSIVVSPWLSALARFALANGAAATQCQDRSKRRSGKSFDRPSSSELDT